MTSKFVRPNLHKPTFNFSMTVPSSIAHTDKMINTPRTAPVQTFCHNMQIHVTEILPNLYLSDSSAGNDMKFIVEKNIKLIINCANECNIPDFITTQQLSICYIRHPLRDASDEQISSILDSCVEQIRATLLRGDGVIVHCMKGMSRSASIVLAYLIRYGLSLDDQQKMTYDDAFDYVLQRHKISPNIGFCIALKEYADKQNISSE